MTTLYANFDYINIFEKLSLIQKNLSEELFIQKIKFENPTDVWKTFNANSNNLLVFFDKLTIQNKIIFINYINYVLLTSQEKTNLLFDTCIQINSIIEDYKFQNKTGTINKIDLYNYFHKFYYEINKYDIIIEHNLNFNLIEYEIDHGPEDEIIDGIEKWIYNFNTILEKDFINIWNKIQNNADEKVVISTLPKRKFIDNPVKIQDDEL